MLKRLADIVFSLTGIALFLPLICIIAFLIKKEDGGAVFYRGSRVGLNRKTFRIFKFRSMVLNAERIGGPSTSEDDPRITRIGRFIRKYKLDEICQLFNVLKGDMSLVGPRPEVPGEVATYAPDYMRIFTVRPGITDLSSLKFHNEGEILKGQADPHEAYRRLIQPEKLRLQLEYVDKRSLLMDMSIIVQTIAVVARR